MPQVRRLLAVGTLLSLAALLSYASVRGGTGPKEVDQLHPDPGPHPAGARVDRDAVARLAESRFARVPFGTYQPEGAGEQVFWLQLQPKLPDIPRRPRDVLVLVDTSASKAQGALVLAQEVARQLAGRLGADDRLALWTVNTEPHDLSRGFRPKADLDDALKDLANEFPAGAVNLKAAMAKAVDSFEGKAGRQRVVLFLGDGRSVAGPVADDDRAKLCDEMVHRRITFFSVPLGARLDPQNLHGLASGSGGRCVRLAGAESVEVFVGRLLSAFAEPVFYPSEFRLPAGVAALPTKLPPLRRDTPTLVVGRMKPMARFDYRLAGAVAGQEVKLEGSEKVPAPEVDNFFLVNLEGQWRDKGAKDRPNLLAADRALAYAFDQNQLARADLLAKAEMALDQNKLEHALNLYKQVRHFDPHSAEAKGGVALVERMRDELAKDRKLNIQALRKQIARETESDQLVRVDKEGRRMHQAPRQPLAPTVPQNNPINEVKARQAVADQQATALVNDAVRQANRALRADPDGALDFLKRTLDGVRNNTDVSDRTRTVLATRLGRAMQAAAREGAVIKRDQENALALRAAAADRLERRTQENVVQAQVRERMRVFHNLMDQAREMEAYQQAQKIRVDLINQGLPVPNAVTAGYVVGLNGHNLHEVQELRRITEERWLATMLQVEKSHVPFPDEPPVEFPPAAQWKAMSDLRKSKFESITMGVAMPKRAFELRDSLNRTVKFQGFDDPKSTLVEALDQLSKRYDLAFDVNEKAFKFEMVPDVTKTEIAQPNPIPEMNATLGTVLRKILARIPVPSGATFLIRKDVIEITTGQFAAAEKTVRAYPVADLVTPIPNSVNRLALRQSASLLGILGGGGVAGYLLGGIGGIGGLGGLGGFSALGALGGIGGLGALGGIGGLGALGGIGGLGALGGGLGALGGGLGALGGGFAGALGGGFNQLGVQGGFRGNFQGNVNLGVGGGLAGFRGGQLGQFGNLGGQFGLQGGNQSQLLITLIRQTVGRPKDWAIQFNPITGQPLNPLDDNANDGIQQDNNQVGFYPPSQALVIKGSALMHSKSSNLIITGAGAGAGMGALPVNRGGDAVARGNDKKNRVNVAPFNDSRDDGPPPDPKKVWQDALARGVDNPQVIIATADFLALNGKWDHAAEFLKADLRQGVVVKPWVYQSLAIALREGGASPEEIERAEVSAADLEPWDGQAFLHAAKALGQDRRLERALAFCRQAARLEPGVPYPFAEALAYAEEARDSRAMEWAAGSLLAQDWPVNNKELQSRALQKLEALAKVLERDGRKDEAKRMLEAVAQRRQRDLVLKLAWQGEADLDLHVVGPAGNDCSVLNRQIIGGGTLIGDGVADMAHETFVAAEAFPGEYHASVERVWGHPLGDKAQLKIIRHQGTPDETEQLVTVYLNSSHPEPVLVKLEGGRRTEAAYVPPPAALVPPEAPAGAQEESARQVWGKLRALADPEATGYEYRGLRGGTYSPGTRRSSARPAAAPPPRAAASDRMFYQTRVAPFVKNSVDVTARAVLSADHRYLKVSLSPVFNTAAGPRQAPTVVNATIPGGGGR
jgi:tetratricopeptide (TPR) repeat protein